MTTTDYERNIVLSNVEYNVVGTRPVRPDGADKVTGRALYGADFDTSGLLHGKVLRSPHAHARIRSIDTSKAEALQGVLAVVTGKDMPHEADESDGTKYSRDNILASDKVLYKGHAVAAVAATNPHVAEEAIGLIEVDYEVLKPVLTAPEAMKDSAPILHEGLKTEELGEKTDKVSNIANHFQHVKGDIAKGFADADVVVEREYNTVTVHQGYIEPHGATALWNTDGRLHIWCSTQGAFTARDATAGILGVPVSQVRVTPMEIGGGFGGKIPVYVEPIAALLSKKSGHAVKVVMSRAEVFESTGPTSGSNIRIKVGAKNDGTITALQGYLAFEAGGYPGSPVNAGAICIFAAYDVDNVLIDGYDVVVNKPKSAPYRAPGAPNAAFACEQAIDELAGKLGMDPIDLRLKNAAVEGTRRPDGPAFPRIGCVEVLEAMKNHPHYSAPLGPNQGRGVAIGYWFNIGFQSSVNINVNSDGTISLIEGSTDIGGTRASISMQAAEVLGIPMEDVRPSVVDTDSIGFTAVTGGSRTTFATGWAAYEAAQDVARQMIERAATIWDVDKDGIELKNGVFQSKADPELKMTFKELSGQLLDTGGTVVGRASMNAGGLGAGGGSFAGNIVDVEVDPDTGKTLVTRMTAIQDAGKAIHPSYVEGQMQGGSVQGIGWALNEEYYMRDDGSMANTSLLDYRMPTSLDIPMIDTVIVEVASAEHPYGVRGVGEANIVPPTPAIANAVHSAIGIRMANLPINSVAIMEAKWKQQGN
ncbi:MAG: oxidoreductase [SAR202 cluster bacterium Casp-Chloro-G4]|nr:xanthine dehydrogenase family protein molybdopterin-binding subunit [Chloroflexota bacterium]MDA1227674.1 xanthine dehydrogenase family protein molybdopterin-binding subunit [Chloroflexota bacterium]PKB61884.1 MAG: oxidoreductase [SAR202 cluster bacterium Casp-Chloro-G4]